MKDLLTAKVDVRYLSYFSLFFQLGVFFKQRSSSVVNSKLLVLEEINSQKM